MTSRIPRIVRIGCLGVAVALYLGLGWWFTETIGIEHEEVSLFPTTGYRVLATNQEGEPELQEWCGQPSAPSYVLSVARPRLGVCLGDRLMPVVIDSYIGGVPYWGMELFRPFHRGNFHDMRKVALLLGLLSLGLVYRLVRRFSGVDAAVVTVMTTAVSAQFVALHATLRLYEVLCATLILAAVVVLSEKQTPRRTNVAATLVGLSLFVNLKAVLILVPLLLAFAVDRRRPLSRVSLAQWRSAAGIIALTTAPLWLFALVDPQRGVGGQLEMRWSHMVTNLDPWRFLAEFPNVLLFWTDFVAYTEHAVQGYVSVPAWSLVPAGLALLWCTKAAAEHFLGRKTDRVAAVAGTLLVSYAFAVVLLYDQTPDNYMPLHAVFGIAAGAAVMAAARGVSRLATRLGFGSGADSAPEASESSESARDLETSTRLPSRPPPNHMQWGIAPALAALFMGLFFYNGVKRGSISDFAPLPANVKAQRELLIHLQNRPDEAVELVSTTYNLAGVLDFLSLGQMAPLQAHRWFIGCPDESSEMDSFAASGSEADSEPAFHSHSEVEPGLVLDADPAFRSTTLPVSNPNACLVHRWEKLLRSTPVRAVVPAQENRVDEDKASLLADSLIAASRNLGMSAELEGTFRAGNGEPVFSLYRVAPHPSRPTP